MNFQNTISRPAHKLISKTLSARPLVLRFGDRNELARKYFDVPNAVSRPQNILISKTQ